MTEGKAKMCCRSGTRSEYAQPETWTIFRQDYCHCDHKPAAAGGDGLNVHALFRQGGVVLNTG